MDWGIDEHVELSPRAETEKGGRRASIREEIKYSRALLQHGMGVKKQSPCHVWSYRIGYVLLRGAASQLCQIAGLPDCHPSMCGLASDKIFNSSQGFTGKLTH